MTAVSNGGCNLHALIFSRRRLMESIILVGMQNAASVAEPYSVALGAKIDWEQTITTRELSMF